MNFDYYIIQSGQAVPENPYKGEINIHPDPRSIFWEFENWKQSHTLPFIGDLPDGSRVKREETEEVDGSLILKRKTGTQGRKGSYERSMIPEQLCKDIILSVENNLQFLKVSA